MSERKRIEGEREAAERALQQSEEQSRNILESISDAFFALDAAWRFTYLNQQAERLLDRTRGELIGETIWECYPGLKGSEFEQAYRQAARERIASTVTSFYADHERWYEVHVYPATTGITVYFRNVTDRQRIEDERAQLLQREQSAREAAENANRIKDEFLAVLSHELRSPLNPILGWAKLLQQGKLDAPRTANALATIERNATLQAQLVDDLLDISRILRGKLTLNTFPLSLSFVISAAIDTVRLAVDAKAIQLNLTLDPDVGQVLGDTARLQQVVWNLLSNAAKFTPPGGQITVTLTQVATHAQIQIKDTGKGIHPDFLPYVFEHFRQEDGAINRKFGGLGLGLAIVRQIVEMHGGTVQAESPGEGLGATFTVSLPLTAIAQTQTQQTHSDAPAIDLTGVQILVVDDESDMRELAKFVLEQYGAKVLTVSSAQAALTTLDQFTPDVLISDIGMPDMDGYMLMQQIRNRAESKQIPAIALTAYAGELDQQQAIAAGFQQHVSKPVEPDELVRTIVQLLQETTDPGQ